MNIVITGASKGMGKAVLDIFANDSTGHHFFICARNADQLASIKDEIEAFPSGHKVDFFAVDVAFKDQIISMAKDILSFGIPIDILVNNTGIYLPGSCYNEPDGLLEKMLQINLFSAYHLSRALIPSMIAQKSGHIFNMCSIAAIKAYANGGSYSISKYALSGFTKNLREELKPFGIKVTGIYPGATMSDSWNGSGVDPNRIMEASDIAKMIYASSQLSAQADVEDIIIRPILGDL